MWNKGRRPRGGPHGGPPPPPFPMMPNGRPFLPGYAGQGFPFHGRGHPDPGRRFPPPPPRPPPPLPPFMRSTRMPLFGASGFHGPMMHGVRMPQQPPRPPMGFMGPDFRSPDPAMHHGGFPARLGGVKRKRGGGQQFQGKKLKPVGEFQCDTCDRSYETRVLLDEHFTTHKKCGIDGCSFEAHPKAVELHVKFQHESGFAEKIMQLSSTAEIEKWKSERKKNFPTAANVVRRQAEQAERLARGELLQDKHFGKFNKMGRGRGRGRGFRGGRGGGAAAGAAKSNQQSIADGNSRMQQQQRPSYGLGIVDPGYISFEEETPKANGNGRGRRGGGKGQFVRGRGKGQWRGKRRKTAISAGDVATIRAGVNKFVGTNVSPVNVTFVSADKPSGSSDSSKMELPSGSVAMTDSVGEAIPNGNQPVTFVSEESDISDSDSPQELSSKALQEELKEPKLSLPGALASLVTAYASSSEVDECVKDSKFASESLKMSSPDNVAIYAKKLWQQRIRTPKPTLLEMLLAKEIRHERNVILQCVRHIVRNNFFVDAIVDPSSLEKCASSL